MSPLPAPFESWQDEVLAAVQEEFDAVITIKMPDTYGPYNSATDARSVVTVGETLIDSRAARVQKIGQPSEKSNANGWSTERRVRVQFAIQSADPVIPKGALLLVEDGGRDPQLEEFTYQVLNSLGSSHAALRTVEASTEAGV